jgi:outer membrane protein OmpA-like peptidoglycan-associated protein
LHHIIFHQSSAILLPEATKELDRVYEWLASDTTIRVRFIGHTDNQGDAEMNLKLSFDRVTEVKRYLVNKGIRAGRMETVGYGGKFPIADNSREQTRKLNRRVEMEILK